MISQLLLGFDFGFGLGFIVKCNRLANFIRYPSRRGPALAAQQPAISAHIPDPKSAGQSHCALATAAPVVRAHAGSALEAAAQLEILLSGVPEEEDGTVAQIASSTRASPNLTVLGKGDARWFPLFVIRRAVGRRADERSPPLSRTTTCKRQRTMKTKPKKKPWTSDRMMMLVALCCVALATFPAARSQAAPRTATTSRPIEVAAPVEVGRI